MAVNREFTGDTPCSHSATTSLCAGDAAEAGEEGTAAEQTPSVAVAPTPQTQRKAKAALAEGPVRISHRIKQRRCGLKHPRSQPQPKHSLTSHTRPSPDPNVDHC